MNNARKIKDRFYEQFARIGRALASPKRLELLDLLCQCEKTVEKLASQASLSVANTSRHLQILRAARLVEGRKEGLHVYYGLADENVCQFFRSLRNFSELRLAEIDRIVADYFGSQRNLKPIDRRKLLERAKKGEVVVLDVRPHDEYAAGHLPNARSVPLQELEKHLKEFPPGKEIVAYCRGPYCVLAQEAVKLLTKKGFRSVRLKDGIAEWKEAGFPILIGKE